jgi:type IV pilus biogenesis protein CpaD/CtpE
VKKIFVIAFVLLTSILAGCAAPKYTATAMANDYESGDVQVVIINDEKTREGFQKAMESWLDKKISSTPHLVMDQSMI